MPTRFDRGSIATWIMVVLVGIPTAISFYPPLFTPIAGILPTFINDILEWLPLGLITNGLLYSGIFLAGFLTKNRLEKFISGSEEATQYPSEVVGCIEKDGVIWRAKATISDDNFQVNVDESPRCPDCLTELTPENIGNVTLPSTLVCPNSDCSNVTGDSDNSEARKVFHRHVERMLNDTNEPYSISNLVDEIDGELTGSSLWKAYVDEVGQEYSDISIKCI